MKGMKMEMTKKMLVYLVLSATMVFAVIDPNVPGVEKGTLVYLPFENSNNMYGTWGNTVAVENPAWLNHSTGEYPRIPDRGVNLWPLTDIRYGVKGTYYDGISMNGLATEKTDILAYDDTLTGTVPAEEGGLCPKTASSLRNLKSHTVTFWVKSEDETMKNANNADTYIMSTGPIDVRWRSTGAMQIHYWPNLDWAQTDADAYNSYGQWVFVAITIDQNGAKFYKGTPVDAPVLVKTIETPTGVSRSNCMGMYVGYRSYVNATYMNFNLDEVRVWGSTDDDSGALSSNDIAVIWAYDYDPSVFCGDSQHPVPIGDINEDCIVDSADLVEFSKTWLTDNRPE